MASSRVVTLSDCLLSPLGMNKELAGHMVLIYQSASQTRQANSWLPCFFHADLLAASGGLFLPEDGLRSGSTGTRSKRPRALIFIK